MRNNAKLLEQRVQAAVGRLKELAGDRDAARAESVALRAEFDRLRAEFDGRDDESKDWRERREQAIGLIRETLAELREPAGP